MHRFFCSLFFYEAQQNLEVFNTLRCMTKPVKFFPVALDVAVMIHSLPILSVCKRQFDFVRIIYFKKKMLTLDVFFFPEESIVVQFTVYDC